MKQLVFFLFLTLLVRAEYIIQLPFGVQLPVNYVLAILALGSAVAYAIYVHQNMRSVFSVAVPEAVLLVMVPLTISAVLATLDIKGQMDDYRRLINNLLSNYFYANIAAGTCVANIGIMPVISSYVQEAMAKINPGLSIMSGAAPVIANFMGTLEVVHYLAHLFAPFAFVLYARYVRGIGAFLLSFVLTYTLVYAAALPLLTMIAGDVRTVSVPIAWGIVSLPFSEAYKNIGLIYAQPLGVEGVATGGMGVVIAYPPLDQCLVKNVYGNVKDVELLVINPTSAAGCDNKIGLYVCAASQAYAYMAGAIILIGAIAVAVDAALTVTLRRD